MAGAAVPGALTWLTPEILQGGREARGLRGREGEELVLPPRLTSHYLHHCQVRELTTQCEALSHALHEREVDDDDDSISTQAH